MLIDQFPTKLLEEKQCAFKEHGELAWLEQDRHPYCLQMVTDFYHFII